MIKAVAYVLIALLVIPQASGQSNQYHACMAKATRFPKDAFEDAINWRVFGGGDAAEHCAALALFSLGLYKEAANRLESLATQTKLKPTVKAEIFGQAAQAWLLADVPLRARALATIALTLYPGNIELLIDRAQAYAALNDHTRAQTDLDLVLKKRPQHIEALTFRASTKRYLGNDTGALSDIKRALSLNNAYVPALLERGNLRRINGDTKGARADWLMVLSYQSEGTAADAARSNIEKMDVSITE